MRGASPVNDEFEVGYNAEFEQSWFRFMQVGRVFMVLFVLAALAGLLGRGPFSHHTLRAPGGSLSVDLEPVARYGTPTQITVHLRPAPGDSKVRLAISSSLIEPLGLRQIIPRPLPQEASLGGMILTVSVVPGESEHLVRFQEQPAVVGPVPITIAVEGGESLHLTQFIMP
jgi:hypothetical protein